MRGRKWRWLDTQRELNEMRRKMTEADREAPVVHWRPVTQKPDWYEASHFWIARTHQRYAIALRDEDGTFVDVHSGEPILDATHWSPLIWPEGPGAV